MILHLSPGGGEVEWINRNILKSTFRKVFISYSRQDRERARRFSDVLRDRRFGVFRDTEDILPTEEWQARLEQLIDEAATAHRVDADRPLSREAATAIFANHFHNDKVALLEPR